MELKSWLKAHIKQIVTVAMIIGVIATAITLIQTYSDISRLRVQATQYNEQLEQTQTENEKIKAILNAENKDDYIEQKAREKGYVKDGEVVFYDISD